jgi:hypothetical protein
LSAVVVAVVAAAPVVVVVVVAAAVEQWIRKTYRYNVLTKLEHLL